MISSIITWHCRCNYLGQVIKMKKLIVLLVVLGLLYAHGAFAQEQHVRIVFSVPPPAPVAVPQVDAPVPVAASSPILDPQHSPGAPQNVQGVWVPTAGAGYIYVPMGATAIETNGVPAAYFFVPNAGWNWYMSPWGPGQYYFGTWTRNQAWHPMVMPVPTENQVQVDSMDSTPEAQAAPMTPVYVPMPIVTPVYVPTIIPFTGANYGAARFGRVDYGRSGGFHGENFNARVFGRGGFVGRR